MMITDEEIASLRASAGAFAHARKGVEELARSAARVIVEGLRQRRDKGVDASDAIEELLLGTLRRSRNMVEGLQLVPGALGWLRDEADAEGERLGVPGVGVALARWIERGPDGVGSGTLAKFMRSAKKPGGLQAMRLGRKS